MMDIKELAKQAGAVIQHIPMCVPEQVRFIFSGEDQLQEYTRLVLEDAPELKGIASVLNDGGGFWRDCSGCHESNEGHPAGPYSDFFRCYLGMGCSECGGIGAVWDSTAYEDMARALRAGGE